MFIPPIDLLMTWGWVKMALAEAVQDGRLHWELRRNVKISLVGLILLLSDDLSPIVSLSLVNMYCSSHSYKMEAVNLNVGGKQREPRREFE
jgi:hypothetical protein